MQTQGIRGEFLKIKQSQRLLAVAIIFFVIAILWIGVGLFSSSSKTSITPQQKKLAAPLQPVLKTEVIDQLENEVFHSDSDLANFTIYKLARTGDNQSMTAVSIDTPDSQLQDEIITTPAPETTGLSESTEPTSETGTSAFSEITEPNQEQQTETQSQTTTEETEPNTTPGETESGANAPTTTP